MRALRPKSIKMIEGAQAAKGGGSWFEAPRACRKLERKNTPRPMNRPLAIKTSVPPKRGGRIETVAARMTMAIRKSGWARRLW